MSDNSESTQIPEQLIMGPHQLADNIPVLTEVISEEELISIHQSTATKQENKNHRHLRKQFEAEMNKKIRRTLQETERRLQKEMQLQLDQLFKNLD